jgi:hypothetical protein
VNMAFGYGIRTCLGAPLARLNRLMKICQNHSSKQLSDAMLPVTQRQDGRRGPLDGTESSAGPPCGQREARVCPCVWRVRGDGRRETAAVPVARPEGPGSVAVASTEAVVAAPLLAMAR